MGIPYSVLNRDSPINYNIVNVIVILYANITDCRMNTQPEKTYFGKLWGINSIDSYPEGGPTRAIHRPREGCMGVPRLKY